MQIYNLLNTSCFTNLPAKNIQKRKTDSSCEFIHIIPKFTQNMIFKNILKQVNFLKHFALNTKHHGSETTLWLQLQDMFSARTKQRNLTCCIKPTRSASHTGGGIRKKGKMKMRKIDNICREKLPQINSLQKIETLLSTYIRCCLIGTKEASKQV